MNKQTEGLCPTECTNSPMRQLLHMHREDIKTTKKHLTTQRAHQ